MNTPLPFRETRAEPIHELIRDHPLGLLVTPGLTASHVPFLLYADVGPSGTLRAHLARSNPQWRELSEASECLVVFRGAEGYVTPSWYSTKAETGKAVPTWNYAAVHVWGRPTVTEDYDWLRGQVEDLAKHQERARPEPWSLDEAPADYIDAMMRGIVGIEIAILRTEGIRKMSQNKTEKDRVGVIRGLRSVTDPHANADLASAMDDLGG